MDACISEISQELPCRKEVLTELYQLLGNKSHRFPPSVYVHGPPGVGKTSLLTKFLNYQSITYAYIDCIEYYTAKLLFESILNKLNGHVISREENYESHAKCDTMEVFIERLNSLHNEKPYVIILKNHIRIADIDANILPVFMRLNQVAPGLNIACILLGCRPLLHQATMQGLPEVTYIHCDQYSKTDLIKILDLQCNQLKQCLKRVFAGDDIPDEVRQQRLEIIDGLETEFYYGYFSIFIDMFYGLCRNVRELLYMSNDNFPAYCRPVLQGVISPTDSRKLWINMKEPFQKAIAAIYCRMDLCQVGTYFWNQPH